MIRLLLILILVLSCSRESRLIDKFSTIGLQFDRFEEQYCELGRVNYHSLTKLKIIKKEMKFSALKDVKQIDILIDGEKITEYVFDHSKSRGNVIYYSMKNIFGKDIHFEHFENEVDHIDIVLFFYHNEFSLSGKHSITTKFQFSNSKPAVVTHFPEVNFQNTIDMSKFLRFKVIERKDHFHVSWHSPSDSNKSNITFITEYESKKKRFYNHVDGEDLEQSLKIEKPLYDRYLAFYFYLNTGKESYENKIVLTDKYVCKN